MNKKMLLVAMIALAMFSGSLYARGASVLDIGISHSYRFDDAQAMDYQSYVPTVRVQLNVRPWFGISFGAMYDFVEGMDDVHKALLSAEMVLRAPIGFFEPFVAIGPMYSLTLPETTELPDSYGVQGRGGFDIRFNGWLSLGLEGTVIVPSLIDVVDGTEILDMDYVQDHLYVGFAVKAKF
jgi:hypothetical protein